jgi:hydrophobic/amphiphilic exporter-1 (mainly G- bacteria), HAE1 family
LTRLVRFCIERPLGVLAIYSGLAVAGLACWRALPQELVPDLQYPRLTVVTVLPNASPEELENLVTKPIEQAAGTVKNVRRVDSFSKEQVSAVNVEFRWDTDMDAALLWLQEKLDLAQDQLPLEARKPTVLRYNPFERPVMLLSVTGRLPLQDVHQWVESRLRPALEKVSGVSALDVSGGLEREIQVDLDAQKLNGHRLSILEVVEGLRSRNVSRSAGATSDDFFEYPVTVAGSFASVAGIREAVIRSARSSRPEAGPTGPGLRLDSLGAVTDGFRERTSFARYDGKDNVSAAIYKRAEAYTLDVSRNVRRALGSVQIPSGVSVTVVYDQSQAIKEGISDVFNNVLAGGVLAFLILWTFLGSRKRAFVVGITIPAALLMTAVAFYALDMTLNLLTLGGLALGVGMLVDSAVVIMENISRHLEAGEPLENSVLEGAREVASPVVFSVLTTMAAFAPIPFASVGVAQRVFTPICVAVLLSQAASLLVGFTLVPSLTALFLAKAERGGTGDRFQAWIRGIGSGPALRSVFERVLTTARRVGPLYTHWLNQALANRRRVLAATALVTLLNAILLTTVIPRDIMPSVDQDQFLVQLTLPRGTRLETTDAAARRVESVLSATPEVAHRSVIVGSPALERVNALGSHQAQMVVDLKARRKRSARRIVQDVRERLSQTDLEGGRVEFLVQGADVFSQVFGQGGADLILEVKGQDLSALKNVADELEGKLKAIPGVARVAQDRAAPSLQTRIHMDETRLARDGLSVADAAEAVLAGVHGVVPTKFREQGKEIDIRVRLRERDRKDLAALTRLNLPGPLDGIGHPLAEYGRLEIGPGPSEIRRRDQSRTILVSASLEGRRLSDVLPEVEKLAAPYRTRRDVSVEISGEVEEARASFQSLVLGFCASLALVYIVLVAQFNTLWTPLLALVAVPLSLNGVAPALILSGNSLNLMSGQGLMILAGIVVNNSLMLLEFINMRRRDGKSPETAVREAVTTRMRPIFMTVAGNLAGLLPLALGIGRGAEMQAPMAVTVIFGLAVSTVMTLLILPVVYLEVRQFFEK